MTLHDLEWLFVTGHWIHFTDYNRKYLKNYDSIEKNDGDLQKSDAFPLIKKTRFDRMMSSSKPNKLPQEQNSYLISWDIQIDRLK